MYKLLIVTTISVCHTGRAACHSVAVDFTSRAEAEIAVERLSGAKPIEDTTITVFRLYN